VLLDGGDLMPLLLAVLVSTCSVGDGEGEDAGSQTSAAGYDVVGVRETEGVPMARELQPFCSPGAACCEWVCCEVHGCWRPCTTNFFWKCKTFQSSTPCSTCTQEQPPALPQTHSTTHHYKGKTLTHVIHSGYRGAAA
jgi:hypothetical protein